MRWRLAVTWLFVATAAGCSPGKVAPPKSPAEASPSAASLDVALAEPPELGADAPSDAPRTRPAPAPVTTREQALAGVMSGNPEGAITFLEPFVRASEHASDEEARLALARALVAVGKLEAAQSVLESAGSAETIRRRSQIVARMGDRARALAIAREGTGRFPQDLALQGQALALLVATGQRDSPDAVRLREGLYDAFDDGRAQSAEGLWAVAQATLARGTGGGFHDANMVLSEAAELAPPSSGSVIADDVALLHASIFAEKYATDEAAQTLEQILERDPWHTDALAALARVAATAMQLAAADKFAREALLVDPQRADAHAVLAHVELVEGRRTDAITRVREQVLARHPGHVDALAVLGAAAQAGDDSATYEQARDTALATRSDDARFFTLAIELLNVLHLYPEAATLAREAVSRLPDDPYAQSSLAITALQLGDETNGRAALERAWKGDRFNERTFNLRKLYRERIDTDYIDVDRGNISLRVPRAHHELVVPHVEQAITRAKAGLDARYPMQVGRMRIELFDNPDDFAIRTVGVPSLGALGVCFGPVITLVGPYHGVHNFDQVVWHELAHTYAIELSRGRVPRWFTEGLSEWESYVADPSWARENAPLVRQARAHGRLRSLADLELAFLRAPNSMAMELAYTQAAYAVRFLGETYGQSAIVAALKGFGAGYDVPTVFASAFGGSMDQLDREFGQWLDAAVGDAGWSPTHPQTSAEVSAGLEQTYARAADLLEREAFDAARTEASRLLEHADGFAVRLLLARIEAAAKQPSAARSHLEKARGFDPLAAEPWLLLTRIEAANGNVEAEKRALASWLQIDAMSFAPAARLLLLAALSDDDASFDRALARCLAIAPLDPATVAAQALLAARAGPSNSARELLAAAEKLEGSPPTYRAGLAALTYERLGDPPSARAAAALALKEKSLPKGLRPRLQRLVDPS